MLALGGVIIITLYTILKYAIRGVMPHLPEEAGVIDLPFLIGVTLLISALALLIYFSMFAPRIRLTPNLALILTLLLAFTFVSGFMLIHLSQSDYQYPVAVMPLSIYDEVGDTILEDWSFLVIPLSSLGILTILGNLYILRLII